MENDVAILRFDKGSKQYQTDSIKYRKMSADKVSQLVAPALIDSILDIGCGTGSQLLEMASSIKRGVGVDISLGMVQKANERFQAANCSNLECYAGDFIELEKSIALREIGFNKIISNYALHHLTTDDKKMAIDRMSKLASENLEMIVIGDLMFFDDPQKYTDQYSEIGYNPEHDFPCAANVLVEMFDKDRFTVTVEKLHPLVGVVKAVRKL